MDGLLTRVRACRSAWRRNSRRKASSSTALDFWNDAHAAALGSTAWRNLIEQALESDRYALYAQPVLQLPARTLLHTEVFARQIEDRGRIT